MLGCFLEVEVLPASVPERAGAETLFWRLKGQQAAHQLQKVWADGGFEGREWRKKMHEQFGFLVEIVKRSDDLQRLHRVAQTVGCRTLFWLDELVSPLEQRLRRSSFSRPRHLALGHDPQDDPNTQAKAKTTSFHL